MADNQADNSKKNELEDYDSRIFAVEDRGHNILLSASAGSGKTTTLINRILKKILEDKDENGNDITVDRFLIVTFTNAAAADLRRKIEEKLGEIIEKSALAGETEKAEKAYKNKILLQKASIGTIDSFCRQVVTQNYISADIDPVFATDDDSAGMIMREAAEEVLEEYYGEKGTDDYKTLRELVDIYADISSDDKFVDDLILKICENAENYPDAYKWLSDAKAFYETSDVNFWRDEIALHIIDAAKNVQLHLKEVLLKLVDYKSCNDPYYYCIDKPDEYAAKINAVIEDYRLIEENVSQNHDFIYSEQIYISAHKVGCGTCRDTTAVRRKIVYECELAESYYDKIVCMLMEKLPKKIPDNYAEKRRKSFESGIKETSRYVKLVCEICEKILKKAYEKKKNRNIYGFSDIAHIAFDILKDGEAEEGVLVPSKIARSISEGFEEIYIDEYQDTNNMQESILYLVSGIPSGRQNVFMVGDVKQSIYRFRKANPKLFIDKARKYKLDNSEGVIKFLTTNFRSRPCILKSTNQVLERLMREEIGGMRYDNNEKLVFGASRLYPPKIENSDKTKVILARDADEIELIACEIKKLIDEKKEITEEVFDRTSQKNIVSSRPIRYSDIAVLAGKNRQLQELGTALAELGIPVKEMSNFSFFERPEVIDILNFLRIIDNPLQDIPLYAVMKSGLFGIKDEEIANIIGTYNRLPHKEKKAETLYEKLMIVHEAGISFINNADVMPVLDRFLCALSDLRSKANCIPVSELCTLVENYDGYYERSSYIAQGNMRKIVDFASAYDIGVRSGLYYFITDISAKDELEKVDNGRKSTMITSYSQNGVTEDKVTILSFHKSKGLEFPVVFLARTYSSKPSGRSAGGTVASEKYYFSLKHIDDQTSAGLTGNTMKLSAPGCLVKYEDYMENIAETQRVLYVAMTRAKEKLFISVPAGSSMNQFTKFAPDTGNLVPPIVDICSITMAEQISEMLNLGMYENGDPYFDIYITPEKEKKKDNKNSEKTDEISAGDSSAQGNDARKETVIRITPPNIAQNVISDTKKDLIASSIDQREDETPEEKLVRLIEDLSDGTLPVKLSVSTFKQKILGEEEQLLEQKSIKRDLDSLALPGDFEDESEKKGTGTPATLTAAEAGTLIHKIMHFAILDRENWPCDRERAGEYASMFAERLYASGIIREYEKKYVTNGMLERFISSPRGNEVKKAEQVHSETSFTFKADIFKCLGVDNYTPREEKTVALQGVIDLYYKIDGKWHLVDFKTDKASSDNRHSAEKYAVQIRCYKEALSAVAGIETETALLYYLRDGKEAFFG